MYLILCNLRTKGYYHKSKGGYGIYSKAKEISVPVLTLP